MAATGYKQTPTEQIETHKTNSKTADKHENPKTHKPSTINERLNNHPCVLHKAREGEDIELQEEGGPVTTSIHPTTAALVMDAIKRHPPRKPPL